jgi:hypothetical protein
MNAQPGGQQSSTAARASQLDSDVPAFRVTTREVLFEVIALQGRDQPVLDLTPADLQVSETFVAPEYDTVVISSTRPGIRLFYRHQYYGGLGRILMLYRVSGRTQGQVWRLPVQSTDFLLLSITMLFQVPGNGPTAMDRRTAPGTAADQLLPCGAHRESQPQRVCTHLSEMPRCRDRLPLDPANLGFGLPVQRSTNIPRMKATQL